ncbi:MAG: hypothetical protein ACL93V_10525 [Candidatus Electrothrix sp. YB6]
MNTKAIGKNDQHPIQLNLFPVKEAEVDGIPMGVLSDGTPYLTMRGLAKICGIHNATLQSLAKNWPSEKRKPRGKKISELLSAQGHNNDSLYIQITQKGTEVHAYTDSVCMAILEYYAFETEQGANETALLNYRLLARTSFRTFIYNRCGYDPNKFIPDSWKNFHERVLLNDQVPVGYFSIFRELADLVIHMIQGGIPIDDHTVPDISVGQIWGKFWNANNFSEEYGARQKHPHLYPDWFPQSVVNPVDVWVYPIKALGEFRIWFYEHYVPKHFPNYLNRKVKQGVFPPSTAELLISTVSKPLELTN